MSTPMYFCAVYYMPTILSTHESKWMTQIPLYYKSLLLELKFFYTAPQVINLVIMEATFTGNSAVHPPLDRGQTLVLVLQTEIASAPGHLDDLVLEPSIFVNIIKSRKYELWWWFLLHTLWLHPSGLVADIKFTIWAFWHHTNLMARFVDNTVNEWYNDQWISNVHGYNDQWISNVHG